MGAMIGSGIFILPGLAMAEAGPAVILAFVLAGVLVLPAAVSIAELGTAMPEAGGDYIFIERGIGPGAGTIAGLGTWLMLMFKGALALYGGMFYLAAVVDLPNLRAVGILLGAALIVVNIVGVKQTGGLQSVMVVVMVIILAGFVTGTILEVDSGSYEPFFAEGSAGFLAGTAMVLISYGGVTKVAAAAEEIENPSRNLPLGLLLSLGLTTALYALIVFVLVGIVDAETLAGTEIPMVVAIEPQFGFAGAVVIVTAAMLALISTANAGILTASRYPLALSRDELLPETFAYIHEQFRTPVIAILVTGGAMLLIVATLPVDEIAKTAGSFQIVVYILVNVALIAFRERDLEWYDPDFESPAYPWLQLFGVVSGIGILTQMDTLPLIGGVGIVILGTGWYLWYARDRIEREGVARDVVRRSAGQRIVDDTRATIDDPSVDHVVIAIQREIDRDREATLLRIAEPLAGPDGRISVIKFVEVPDQAPLETIAAGQTAEDAEFEERTDELARDIDAEVVAGEIVSHDTKHAIVNYAERVGADTLIGEREVQGRLDTLLGRDTDWIMENAPCDVVFVQNRGLEDLEEIAIVTDRSPFNDPLKVELANAIGVATGARIRVLFGIEEDAPDSLHETVADYHTELDAMCDVPIESEIVRGGSSVETLVGGIDDADLVMLSTEVHRRVPDAFITRQSDRIAAGIDRTVLLVHSRYATRHTFLRPILDAVLFR
jgi:amino acid transporter